MPNYTMYQFLLKNKRKPYIYLYIFKVISFYNYFCLFDRTFLTFKTHYVHISVYLYILTQLSRIFF